MDLCVSVCVFEEMFSFGIITLATIFKPALPFKCSYILESEIHLDFLSMFIPLIAYFRTMKTTAVDDNDIDNLQASMSKH